MFFEKYSIFLKKYAELLVYNLLGKLLEYNSKINMQAFENKLTKLNTRPPN